MILLDLIRRHYGKIAVAVVILAAVIYILILFSRVQSLSEENLTNLEAAHNQIAEMSQTIQESETIWSRLAQEREDQAQQLQTKNEQLLELINSRDEQIHSLTTAVATIRNIHVIVDGPAATETQVEDRVRVDFDQTYHELIHVTGYTLSNPAYAELSLYFNRPINFIVTVTQTESGQWRTYLTSDFPDLQIGEIESSINPQVVSLTEQGNRHSWEDGFEVGVFGGIGVSGQSGAIGTMIGYDFGNVSVGVNASGIFYPGGGDMIIGLYGSLNIFDL